MYLSIEGKEFIVNTLKQDIPKLQAIYLFGSQSDGTATKKSDIDIAYLSEKKLSNVERWDVSQKLALIFSQDVDLIDISGTNTIFRYEVESFETLAYSFYLRFQEERKPIVDEIMKNRSVFGKSHV